MNREKNNENEILRERIKSAKEVLDIVKAIVLYNQSPDFEKNRKEVTDRNNKKNRFIEKYYDFYNDPNFKGDHIFWSQEKRSGRVGVVNSSLRNIDELKIPLSDLEDEDLWPCYSSIAADNMESFYQNLNIVMTYNLCNYSDPDLVK